MVQRELCVELYGIVIGSLVGDDPRTFDFRASEGGLTTFGPNSPVLSTAVRLTRAPRKAHAQRRRDFFAGLLPEGDQLELMLTGSGLRRWDTPGFLARYGRDVAGALQIWDPNDPNEPPTPTVVPVDAVGVHAMFKEPRRFPLGNAGAEGRSSLAGVQPKIVLARKDGSWCRVEGGQPSTHILKPQLAEWPTLIFDEEYGSRLLRRLGLTAYASWIETFEGLPALVVERFDRDAQSERIHQEDFTQALGATGVQKYQTHGGAVSLKRMAHTLRTVGAEDDLPTLARLVVLASAFGNLDMHAKNLGLIHHRDGSVRLAPAYDFVPQAHLPVKQEVALAVDGRYADREITADHLVREFDSWRLPRGRALVGDVLTNALEVVRVEDPHDQAWGRLQDDLVDRITRLLGTV